LNPGTAEDTPMEEEKLNWIAYNIIRAITHVLVLK
jgi:hypothetical protein